MEKGFFPSLFDFSFSSFITPKLVKVLYALSLIFLVLMYIGIAVVIFGSGGSSSFDSETYEITQSGGNTGWGIAWLLIGGPILGLLYAIFYRVIYELIIVVFRIYETVRDELALQRELHPQAVAALAQRSSPAVAAPVQAPPPGPPAPPAPPVPPGPPAPPAPPTPGS